MQECKRVDESELINSIIKEAGEDWKEQIVTNPETGRRVKVKSLSSKEQKKYRKDTKKKKMTDKEVYDTVQKQLDQDFMKSHFKKNPGTLVKHPSKKNEIGFVEGSGSEDKSKAQVRWQAGSGYATGNRSISEHPHHELVKVQGPELDKWHKKRLDLKREMKNT